MKKSEIIAAAAYVNVPQGASLIERDTPTGLSISCFTGSDAGGAHIMIARMFEEQLTEDTVASPDEPSPALFARLHQASLWFYEAQIGSSIIDAFDDEIKGNHRKVVAKLRELAAKLGMSYTEPKDPLLAD